MELFTTVMNRITGNLAAVLLPRGQPKSSSDKQEEVAVVGPTTVSTHLVGRPDSQEEKVREDIKNFLMLGQIVLCH